MGKKGNSSSWLTAVKRAFRSPTKDSTEKVRNQRRKHDQQPQEQEQEVKEKKEKRGTWLFSRKATNQMPITGNHDIVVSDEHKNAIVIAMATAAASEAAMEAARAAGPSPKDSSKYHYAAVVIQTAFRGYLARRALGALKGIVKLQALVRGHNVRKQAKMTLRCMQALVRVQSRVLDQRLRQTTEGIRNSTFSDTNSMIGSLYLQEISDRRSMSKEGSGIPDGRAHTVDEVKAMLRRRKETSVKHQRNASQAFSEQMCRTGRNSSIGSEKELGEQHQWLDRWMATKAWDNRGRASTDQRRGPNKTVEMDTISQLHSCLPPQHQRPKSPHHRPNQNSPSTPAPSKARALQVRSASPRFSREERNNHTSQTPSLRSNYHYTGALHPSSGIAMPNYMAATESAKARARSQSAPRQRTATPEREMSGPKKRLSYPVAEPYNLGNGYCNVKSPSFKSVIEQQSNYSSCRTESVGGDVSPSTASDQFWRWLR